MNKTPSPPPPLRIHPPLLNSASPWATSEEDLTSLLLHPSTGAVTTRTSLLAGFSHDESLHRYLFYDASTSKPSPGTFSTPPRGTVASDQLAPAGELAATGTLNSLGYSPHPLSFYLSILSRLSKSHPQITKTVIISVTGSPADIPPCYQLILHSVKDIHFPLAMEINLSCPNIPSLPPPAYSSSSLTLYLSLLPANPQIPIGIKTPPYTYASQFSSFVDALKPHCSKVSFVTCVNTLGCSILLDSDTLLPQLPGQGMGGLAGPALHPLALGNVKMMRDSLDGTDGQLRHVAIIGVGGVSDADGYKRMRAVGAGVVAIATALGKLGTEVFAGIERGLDGKWDIDVHDAWQSSTI